MVLERRIPTQIISSVKRSELNGRALRSEFEDVLSDFNRVVIAGLAKNDPQKLFASGLFPKHKIELFDTRFYFTHVFQIPELRFFVGYVVQPKGKSTFRVAARIFYKDLSLSWRVASHYTIEDGALWVGKGDVRNEMEQGHELVLSNESTTDLPHEMQTAMESLLQYGGKPKGSQRIIDLVLRRAPDDRIEPYRDFVAPRVAAQSNPNNLINRNRSIASFATKSDPASLKIKKGFEPDFETGELEKSQSKSRLYGGILHRFRFLSKNRKVQYYFFAGATHVWIVPPQSLTTELSTYGVRTIDVVADDDLFIPGYEYHHYEETDNGLELYSQIPAGYAGEICPADEAKADASPWLDRLPVIQEFRRVVLKS